MRYSKWWGYINFWLKPTYYYSQCEVMLNTVPYMWPAFGSIFALWLAKSGQMVHLVEMWGSNWNSQTFWTWLFITYEMFYLEQFGKSTQSFICISLTLPPPWFAARYQYFPSTYIKTEHEGLKSSVRRRDFSEYFQPVRLKILWNVSPPQWWASVMLSLGTGLSFN